jgi:2-Cys peroxiredoxin 5
MAAAASLIKVGDKFPTGLSLYENSPEGKVSVDELLAGKKVIIFGVPGAFTPGCHKTHLPGYVKDAEKLKGKGIGEIVCISVNDPFVMQAWGENQGATGKVRMLADTNAEVTKALGLAMDVGVLGGVRSKRYSLVVDNGVVTQVNTEPEDAPLGLTCSLASAVKV